MINELRQDLHYAVRWLMREPLFALTAITTLALGIGANAAAFGIVNGVLIAPLPYPQPEQLVTVREVAEAGTELDVAWPNFSDWSATAHEVTLAAHTTPYPGTVVGGVEPARPAIVHVSARFFDVVGVMPARGRTFAPDEAAPGGVPAVIVSDAFWRRELAGEPDLSRLSLQVLGASAQVVGVMPPGFSYPRGAQLWLAIEPHTEGMTARTAHNFQVTGRLRPGATAAGAQLELSGVMRRIRAEHGANGVAVAVHDLQKFATAGSSNALLVLFAASGVVLLVACTNLASALLSRSTGRRRELAVRASLGASRRRLVRQLLTESVLLALLGAAAGLMVAHLLISTAVGMAPDAVPRLDEIRLDGRVLGFTAVIALVTAVAFGSLPAFSATSAAPYETLRDGGRATGSRAQRRAGSALISAEVALALVLLISAGLLVRSLWNVARINPGFDAEGVLAVSLALQSGDFDPAERVGYYDRLLERVSALQGVEGAGIVRTLPLSGHDPSGTFHIEGNPDAGASAEYRVVSPGYFDVMRMDVMQGRDFTAADRAGSLPVVIISGQLAQRYFPGADPIGQRISTGGMDREGADVYATIVGVVSDVRTSLTAAPPDAYYVPLAQRPSRMDNAVVMLRTSGPPAAASGAVRNVIREVDGNVPFEVQPLTRHLADSLTDRRFMLLVFGSFAGIALLLAGIGIYGVVASAVAGRTREIGVRIALGAGPLGVLWTVSRSAMASVIAGVVAGITLAMFVTGALAALLYGIEPVDTGTFAVVAMLITAIAWLAALVPARRATRVPPVEALRAE
jgi:putative ABC transport system permease protein